MSELSAAALLHELHARGALRIRRVRFRRNRSTIWSLTQSGTVLNLHAAFRRSEPELLDAFALIATEQGIESREAQEASRMVAEWPPVLEAIEEARSEHDAGRRVDDAGAVVVGAHCCATAEQRRYLRALYTYFNRTRFNGLLPPDVPVRLSHRMRSALGHMLPGERQGVRYVSEIALNVDLMLEGNGAERVDTLLHEMAHAADYLESGATGHGRSWRAWAVRVGCTPDVLYERPVRRRGRRRDAVTRVPPLPFALHSQAA